MGTIFPWIISIGIVTFLGIISMIVDQITKKR
jgi:hypothetical protein